VSKVPLSRAKKLADSLGVNRARFMKMLLTEYHPGVLEAIEGSLGEIIPGKY
jgi:hypothetical protein